jgi:predicted TIM-barrel fold metal-dependent hydrolase
VISADSHVVEPPVLFKDYLGRQWREQSPRLVPDHEGGQAYQVPGLRRTIGLGLVGAAGQPATSLRDTGTLFEAIRPGAWQPNARIVDQEIDGITAEVLYPTIGLFLLNHANREFVAATMRAYNTWLAEFCSHAPHRLIGCGASAVMSPGDAVDDLVHMRDNGLRGALLPLEPSSGKYTDPEYNALWVAAEDLKLPITFHALPSTRQAPAAGNAAPALLTMWEAQELLTGLLFSGVLHRYPRLRIVFAEVDAGWVPHLAERLDHYFALHGNWLNLNSKIEEPPSAYLRRAVYFTFQDDRTALLLADDARLNLMWASDFPHAESTWPRSRFVAEAGQPLCSPASFKAAFSGRARELYGLP